MCVSAKYVSAAVAAAAAQDCQPVCLLVSVLLSADPEWTNQPGLH